MKTEFTEALAIIREDVGHRRNWAISLEKAEKLITALGEAEIAYDSLRKANEQAAHDSKRFVEKARLHRAAEIEARGAMEAAQRAAEVARVELGKMQSLIDKYGEAERLDEEIEEKRQTLTTLNIQISSMRDALGKFTGSLA